MPGTVCAGAPCAFLKIPCCDVIFTKLKPVLHSIMAKNKTLTVKGTEIVLFSKWNEGYVSITDIARFKNSTEPKDIVKNWMRSRSTIEFLGLW